MWVQSSQRLQIDSALEAGWAGHIDRADTPRTGASESTTFAPMPRT